MNAVVEQGSVEWRMARVGKVTASRIADVQARIKTGEAADRRNYKAQLVAEILTGEPQDDCFLNDAMRFGIEQEQFARAAYEVASGVLVEQVGLIDHPRIARAAASPDGLVGTDGLLEIKCPKMATHLGYVLAGRVPAIYQGQMLWQMACAERDWCDFVSFRPELPERLRLFCVRLPRDDNRIREMERDVIEFICEVGEMVEKLRGL